MRTGIVTDSNSGIFAEEGREIGVHVIPMPVLIDGKPYIEGQNISHSQFFRFLSEHKAVTTSQPSVIDVLETWDRLLQTEYDELVYIPMSSGLSGSCSTAQGLSRAYNGRVEVVDNHRISVTQRHCVLDALELRERGCCAREIREALEDTAFDSIVFVGVNTLEYLKASGRVTAAGAAIGTAINIKPLLVITGERLDAYAKIRGTKKCQARLIDAIREQAARLSPDGKDLRIGAAASFVDEEMMKVWHSTVEKAFPDTAVRFDPLTFCIAGHVGPNAFGIGISRKTGNAFEKGDAMHE